MNQDGGRRPVFQSETTLCLMCHDSKAVTGGVPGVIVLSVLTDRLGYTIGSRQFTPHSDIVALLVQTHQAQVHNLGPRYQVSPQGGRSARWSRDGTLLYFVETGREPSQPQAARTA